MDAYMLQWWQYREMLNSLPLAHQELGVLMANAGTYLWRGR
jgi:hypothetical protein